MEVVGCSQVHFISAIKGGKLIKMHNIAPGKSVLKFKNIKQIYDSDGSKCRDSLPVTYQPIVDRSLAMTNCVDKANVRVKIESVDEEDELDLGTVTLKQLRQSCKSKKRKAIEFVAVKQEVCEEDDLELKETLVSLRRKVLKKAKSEKKEGKKTFNSPSASPSPEIDDKPSSLAIVEISSEIYKPLQIKLEDYELCYEQPLAICRNHSDDHWNSTSEMAGPCECYSSYQYTITNSFQPTSVDIQNCSLNQIPYELIDHTWNDLFNPESSCRKEIMMIKGSESFGEYDMSEKNEGKKTFNSCSASPEIGDKPGSLAIVEISSEISKPLQIKLEGYEPCYEQLLAICRVHCDDRWNSTCEMVGPYECYSSYQDVTTNSFQPTSVDTQNCVLNQTSYELIDHAENDPFNPESSSCEEIMMIEGSESFREYGMSDQMTCDKSPERVLSECDPLAFQDTDFRCFEGDDAISDGNLSLESPCIGEETQNDDSRESKDVNMHIETTCVDEDRRSSVDNFVAMLSCSPPQCSNAIEESTVTAATEASENVMMPHSPGRLLSARKIISPTSQEKLRKAMNLDGQQDDVETHSCKGKLLFERNETRSSSSRQHAMVARIDSSSKRQRMRKGKYEGRVPHSRRSVNGAQTAQGSQNVGNICSVQMCSQKAIAFSKQQVHDMDRIATKLVSELRSMKSIIVDALQHESRMGTKSKFSTDEARLAVENAGKVEETAQRWLDIMSRDCNRFCKIMSLAEADVSSPEKVKEENVSSPETKTVTKERKIMFADEAGGNLCDVKVFKKFDSHMDLDTPAKRLCIKAEP